MTDPTKCPECKGPMKPLFSGYYCPQDCDKPEVLAARKVKADAEAAAIAWKNAAITWKGIPVISYPAFPQDLSGPCPGRHPGHP